MRVPEGIHRERSAGRARLAVASAMIGLVLVVAAGACGSKSINAPGSKDAKKDVAGNACAANPNGNGATATLTVTNHTSKTSSYQINVEYRDASSNDVKTADALHLSDVAAGQSKQLTSTVDKDFHAGVRCTIATVARLQSR